MSLPGGCAIGVAADRPAPQGARRRWAPRSLIEHGYVEAARERLKGARITTDLVTVTGTENLMMAAALAEGETVLENAAREPEVSDLARLLVAMGARIEGAGTERIVIEGVRELARRAARGDPGPHRGRAPSCSPAAITGGDVTVRGRRSAPTPDGAARQARGVRARRSTVADDCDPRARGRRGRSRSTSAPARTRASRPTCRPSSWRCSAWPTGISKVTETIFENRFMHVAELLPHGRRIEAEGTIAVVQRRRPLYRARR